MRYLNIALVLTLLYGCKGTSQSNSNTLNIDEAVSILESITQKAKLVKCTEHDSQFGTDDGWIYYVVKLNDNIQVIKGESSSGPDGIGGKYAFYYHNGKPIFAKAEYFISGGQVEPTKRKIYFENEKVSKCDGDCENVDKFIQISQNLYQAAINGKLCELQYNDNFTNTEDIKHNTPPTKNEVKPIAQNLDFLKSLNGSYSKDFWENPLFVERVKKMLGSKYDILQEVCCIDTPAEVKGNIFSTSSCESHNCGATNYIIVVDIAANTMYAGLKKEGKISTYSENGSDSPDINEWKISNK